jgi:hypothetical protein
VGWWPFNGNANDESGNGNDGTVNGATLTVDRDGNSNKAYFFDGINDVIIVPDNINLRLLPGDFTIALWYKIQSYGLPNRNFIIKTDGPGSTNKWVVQKTAVINGGPSLSLHSNGSLGSYYLNAESIEDTLWHNMLVIRSGDIFKIYGDGIQLSSSSDFQMQTSFEDIRIGGDEISGGGHWHHGKIDDIAIYNRALTEQEIQNLFTGTNETVDTGDGAAPLPQGIPYQAAARDAQGQAIVSAPVNVRFSLHEGAADGATSYIESHSLTTNSIGLFNTVFGNGTPEQSAFDSINWAATTKFLQVEIDLGDGYVDMGTTQLLSVPYAFRSEEAARIKNAGLPIFADNAAALAGGLVAGEMYRTATGDLKVVY